MLPAGLAPPRSCCRWGPRVRRCLGFPRRGREDAMLGASPVLCLFGGCGGKRRRRPGLGWEAPDTVPRTVGNRLFRELVTPPCPPPSLLLAGSRGSCGSSRMPVPSTKARARQAVRRKRRERGGRLGVPAYSHPPPRARGFVATWPLARGPGSDGFGGCEKSNPDFLRVERRELASSRCSGSPPHGPPTPPGCAVQLGGDTPAAWRAPSGTWSVCLSILPPVALPLPVHPCPAPFSPRSGKAPWVPAASPREGDHGVSPPPPPFTLLPPCPPGPENPKHVLHRPYLGRARERAGNLPARAAGEVAMGKEPAIGAVAPCSQKIRCPHVPWTGVGGVSTGAGCPAPAPLTSPSAPSRHLSAPLAQACFPSPPASASTRPRTHPPAGLCRFHCLLPFAISSICSLPPPPRATASPPPVPSPPQAHPCPPAPWGASRRRGATPALPLEKRELTGARIMPPCTAFDANPGVPVPPAPAPADPWESWKVLSMGVRGSGPPPSTKAGGYLW